MIKIQNILIYLFFALAFTFGYLAFTSNQSNVTLYFSVSCACFLGIILFLYYQLSLEKKKNELMSNQLIVEDKDEEELLADEQTTSIDEDEEVTKLVHQLETFIPTINPTGLKTKEDFLISKIVELTNSAIGLLYLVDNQITVIGSYAHIFENEDAKIFNKTEGILGQVVKSKTAMHLKNIPENYIKVVSGLGESYPKNALITPLMEKQNVVGIIEIASFSSYSTLTKKFIEQAIPIFINTLKKTSQENE